MRERSSLRGPLALALALTLPLGGWSALSGCVGEDLGHQSRLLSGPQTQGVDFSGVDVWSDTDPTSGLDVWTGDTARGIDSVAAEADAGPLPDDDGTSGAADGATPVDPGDDGPDSGGEDPVGGGDGGDGRDPAPGEPGGSDGGDEPGDDGQGDDPGGDDPGDGSADDPGDGSGDGPGDGSGDDPGDGSGDEPGDGSGDGPGDGSGDGSGDEPGDGSGDGPGDGSGDEPGDDPNDPADGEGPGDGGAPGGDDGSGTGGADSGDEPPDDEIGDEPQPPAPGLEVAWCRLWHPAVLTASVGQPVVVSAHVYVPGQTDQTSHQPDPAPWLIGELGYGPIEVSPEDAPDAFTWVPLAPEYDPPSWVFHAHDRYVVPLAVDAPGLYDYGARFSSDYGQTWRYCDLDGSQNGYDVEQSGRANITP